MPKETDAFEVGQGPSKTLDEIGKGKGIERMSESDIIAAKETAKLEEFMNQVLTVVVAADGTPGALPVICPTVNGINQPIIRGNEQKIKRKYVEALARSRITNYEQRVEDAARPENIQMNEITAITYPFSVLQDPHRNGGKWLQAILAQP